MLSLYNDLTRKKEKFYPIDKKRVRMYVCGVTVYDDCHIGHARSAVVFDVLRRLLEYLGYEVTFVKNFTDIDDKIIKKASQEGIKTEQIAERYIKSYDEDAESLSIKAPTYSPRATDMIGQIVQMCRTLEDKGFAYSVDGDLFFDIKKFKSYGKLSGKNIVELEAGSRVEINKKKHHPLDFVLWKKSKPGEPKWQSPWGEGRPGWHIECSAMSTSLLGPTFDIHGGGEDLIFPHHENEIAQSEGCTGTKSVNYWLHGEHLIVEGKKMSKSLGNFYTLRDIINKGYAGVVVRYLLASTYYRQQLNFTFAGLDAARNALERYNDFIVNLKSYKGSESDNSAGAIIEKAKAGFEDALDDDLNVSGALGVVFDFIREINRIKADKNLSADERDNALDTINAFDSVLNFTYHINTDNTDSTEIESLIQQRADAKKNKDFVLADKIRADLLKQGIILEDSRDGTKWKKKV